jgi:amino acid adenylation domain-containing protein
MKIPVWQDWSESWIEGSIPERFRFVAASCAEQEAIDDGKRCLTFGELDRLSDCVQTAILNRIGDRSDPVVVIAGQTCLAVVGLLGSLKAGKFYVVFDPFQPVDWLAKILVDLQPALILYEISFASLAFDLGRGVGKEVIAIEGLLQDNLHPAPMKMRQVEPTDLAAVFYTSGTTGRPKGIMMSQRSLLSRAYVAAQRGQVQSSSRVLGLQLLMFGLSISSLYGPLLNGAYLVLGRGRELGPYDLLRILQEKKITSFLAPPTLLRSLVLALESQGTVLEIEYLGTGGERLYVEDYQRLRACLPPDAIFDVLLGSTETVGAYASFRPGAEYLEGEGDQARQMELPSGWATTGMEISLVDSDLQLVALGEVGEIIVRNAYLADGYWNQPEATAKRFLPDPAGGKRRIFLSGDLGRFLPDGNLIFLGRKDDMVKVRGYRVELEAVEAALRGLPGVREAAVVSCSFVGSDNHLVAYIVPEEQPGPSASAIRRQLSQVLPDYSLPAIFVEIDSLPKLATNKVDRQALPAPDQVRPLLETPYAPARTPYEERLCTLWAEMLGWKQVGIHDPFLELGGHSLLAARLVDRVVSEFQVEIPLRMLFEAPTVADMAETILRIQVEQLPQSDLEKWLDEIESDVTTDD